MAEISLTDLEVDAAVKVLRSGALREGSVSKEFEEAFANKVGAEYAITCANGSAALHLSYLSFLNPGDEVLVPAYTFIATATMVMAAGGKPIFCDVDPETFLIDLDDAKAKITDKTVAISPVHLFGNVCDIDEVNAFARTHHLKIVWDCAQAHGATYKEQDVGSFADFACYSFYPSKNMFVGEGGIITTSDKAVADKLRHLKSHGQTGKYYHTLLGLNYRMTDVEAAIGLAQLKRLDSMLATRRRNFKKYNEAFSPNAAIKLQKTLQGANPAVHLYCILIDAEKANVNRDQLQVALKDKGIDTGVHYPRGLHQQPIMVEAFGEQNLKNTENLAKETIALPVHHGLEDADVDYVIDAVLHSLQ